MSLIDLSAVLISDSCSFMSLTVSSRRCMLCSMLKIGPGSSTPISWMSWKAADMMRPMSEASARSKTSCSALTRSLRLAARVFLPSAERRFS